MMMYSKFRPKDQIIELEVTDQKIYSYPASDYIDRLSERTREQIQIADATFHDWRSRVRTAADRFRPKGRSERR